MGRAKKGKKRESQLERQLAKKAGVGAGERVPAEWVQNSLLGLIADALYFHRASVREGLEGLGCRHARQSIILAALAIESAANSLLAATEMQGQLRKEVEKMGSLSKIDACLHLRGSRLDRGRMEVQRAAELVSARNEFVHPKVLSWRMEVNSLTDGDDRVLVNVGGEVAFHLGLNIPRRADLWKSTHSLSVLQALIGFLGCVFESLLIERRQLQEMFCPFIWIGGQRLARVQGDADDEISKGEPGLDISALRPLLDTGSAQNRDGK